MTNQTHRLVSKSAQHGVRVADEVQEMVRAAGSDVIGSTVTAEIGCDDTVPSLNESPGHQLPAGALVQNAM